MVARRPAGRAAAAFRPSAAAVRGRTPTRRQAIALLTALVVVAAGITVAAFVVKPSKARAFQLFYGSVFIDDDTSPVAIDLASGKPTVRLSNAFRAVSATSTADLDMFPLAGGNTLMLNPTSGEFNMVDSTGFVVKTTNGGVQLPQISGTTTSTAVAAGSSAYIVRSAPQQTSIYLVGTSTVSAASGPHAAAKARAYATLARPLADQPVPAASANGGLWMLTGSDPSAQAITELTVPAGSNAGATLTAVSRGVVSGAAAMASATRNADGTGGDVAAVASPSSIQVFSGTTPTKLAVSAGAGVDRILSASNAQGGFVFLYHSTSGWSRVTEPTSGTGPARVTHLGAIGGTASLAVPAQSDGITYTMDTASGALWQIRADGTAEPIPDASTYPFQTAEVHRLTEPKVLADGSRVVFNSRTSYQAEVVFSDGSHAPRTIDKHSAVTVDPSGATALADAPSAGKATTGRSQQKPAKAQRNPAQTINNKINCKTTRAVPHVPTLTAGDRAARSIGLTWTYPLLDPSDCIPSTYVVSVKVLTPGAPSTASQVTVQGEDGVTLTHLFPATEYELSVAAYINSQHSTSQPVRVTTGPEGPAAPTGVRATADSAGNWTVAWNSCGGVQQGCVPSVTWYVLPHFCDGRGLSGVPARVTVAGDPTQHSFSTQYPGSDALLGRGLCFAVQGVSPQGTVGDTSALTAVAYSWTPPDASALTLDASQPPPTTLGQSASTRVDLGLGSNPVRDVGGVGARITFTLNTPQGPKTQTVTWTGNTNHVSASFPGIQAGAQYTAKATVAPPNHPASAVSTHEVTVVTRSNWPALSANANCTPNPGPLTTSCTLSVKVQGLSSNQANGERFDASGELTCDNAGYELARNGFDPGTQSITRDDIDLFNVNGECHVTLQLVESSSDSDPKVFGGSQSPTINTTVNLGSPSKLGAAQSDFAADWDPTGGSDATVKYTGNMTDAQVDTLTNSWNEQLTAPNGTPCGSSGNQPTHAGIQIPVQPLCVNQFGGQNGWQVRISYTDRGTPNAHTLGPYTLNGGPPGYHPCTVSSTNFAAAWEATPIVDVTFIPGGALTAGCSAWNFYVEAPTHDPSQDPADGACGHAADPGSNPLDKAIPVDTACTPAPAFSVVITYVDTAGDKQTLPPVLVSGTPPPP